MNDAPSPHWPERMVALGCGHMAGAMIARWLEAGLPPQALTVVRPSGTAVAPGVRVVRSADELAGEGAPDVLLIGTKPQLWGEVRSVAQALSGDATLVLSIMAGPTLASLRADLPGREVVRLMPNLPVRFGKGVVAVHPPLARGEDRWLAALLLPLGHVEPLADEAAFEAVTALAGCGPAFVFRYVDAMAAAGERLGLGGEQAAALARATLVGAAAQLAADEDATPTALADRVASKGGSTRAGLDRLDRDGALQGLLAETLEAARARGRELAESPR